MKIKSTNGVNDDAQSRRRDQTQKTLRRELVTRAAASRARASIAWTQDQRVRPEELSDAEWACVLVRDAEPGTAAAVIAVALACEVADRAEARVGVDPRQLGLFAGESDAGEVQFDVIGIEAAVTE